MRGNEKLKRLIEIRRASERHWVGDGFPVSSIFSYADRDNGLDPFLLLDYAAPMEFPADGKRRGVGGHPHRGFETVTIVFQGGLEHRDSTGAGGKIGPGDVQWMTAGGGIIHEEFHSSEFAEAGGTFEVAQLWVNLPASRKNEPAGYQTISSSAIPSAQLAGNAGNVRVIAGAFDGTKGPAKTFTHIDLWDLALAQGSHAELPIPSGRKVGILVRRGRIGVGDGRIAEAGDFCIWSADGDGVGLESLEESELLLISGEPINEPIVGAGPFVMNTQAEIEEAFKDFRSGRMGQLV